MLVILLLQHRQMLLLLFLQADKTTYWLGIR